MPFLGTIDKLGTAYEDSTICTGYGAHIALPILRDYLEKNPSPTEEEAKALVHNCMELLFYRDARSFPKYQIGIITADGIDIQGPISVKQDWKLALN